MHEPIAKEMCAQSRYDAVVVGSGPNGMACAITMQQAGCSVLVVEANPTLGGGARTAELTVPGFKHDVCSAVHPLGIGSPFFRTLPLDQFGLKWINPQNAYVHGLAPERALVVSRDVKKTVENLGWGGESYGHFFDHFCPNWDDVSDKVLHLWKLTTAPSAVAHFGLRAIRSVEGMARTYLHSTEAQAVWAGTAAHAALPFDEVGSASIGLSLAVAAHTVGWPIPQGGAQSITDALVGYFRSLGGEVVAGCRVRTLAELPTARYVFLDITPRQFLRMAWDELSERQRHTLQKYKYGPAVFKVDWALSEPIPWNVPGFAAAPTVHLGGTLEHLAKTEGAVWKGMVAEQPYVLLTQPSLFDPTRAPEGKHTAWAYIHFPVGWTADMTEVIEQQVERYARGFREVIIGRSVKNAQAMELVNENLVDGDINGGSLTLNQLFARPTARLIPYKTPLPNVYLCSSSTPPGSGVHGMCGYYAAQAALLRAPR